MSSARVIAVMEVSITAGEESHSYTALNKKEWERRVSYSLLEGELADASRRVALAAYHAEVIDKVGSMIGGLTYGAKKDTALKLYETALKLAPDSAIARIEYANGLVMLEGKKGLAKAEKLYEEAAACEPLDAMERLDVEQAKAELED